MSTPRCKRKSLLSLHFRWVQPIAGRHFKMSGITLQILSIFLFNSHALPVFGQTATCSIPLSADYRAELNVDSDYFPESKLYLAGEVHNIKSNPIVKFQLLKHLHANNNVRYYLIEAGPATSYLLNKFLKTGNEDYRISYFLSEPDFWSNLLLFNKSVNKSDRIKVIGFDFDLNHIYQKALIDLLNEIQKHDFSMNRMIETVIQPLKKGVDESNRDEINRQLVKFFESLPNFEKVKIGEPLSTILSIINNKTPVTSRVKRDKITFQAIIESNIGFGRVFGQYGVSHVNLRLKNLSHLLQNDKRSPFYQEVTILGYQYYNCESVWQMDTVFYRSIGIMNQINSKIGAIENPDHDLTLVDLTCVDRNTGRLGRTADYIIICQNQKVSSLPNNVQH
ncbi:MAG: hypothetical protein MI975_16855 [Cytophagales bacterium]|nr:hypothetical protein [Cytophagales bacterium]